MSLYLRAGLLTIALATAQAAHGQQEPVATLDTVPVPDYTPAAEAPVVAEQSSGVELETVIVTSRRRQERAQDVPISLAVLDGDDLADAGLFRPQDIQERVPGLVVTVPNARLTQYTIRGLGSTSNNDGMESSVGIFLDGVYLGRQGLSMFDLVDLDRVEILRGPQGTLFGKNTTAGALNIVTKAPSPYFESTLEGSYGNEGYRQLRGSITGPLWEGVLAGRLTGYATDRDGNIENLYDGSELNNRHKRGLRGQLLWTPTETLSGRLIAEYGEQNEKCCVYPLVGPVRQAVLERDAFMEYTRASTNPYDREADTNTRTSSAVRQKAVSLEFNWDVADSSTLTSITAFRDWQFTPYSDDAMSLDVVPETGVGNNHHQFSQEFRLAADFDGYDAVFGLFYLRQHLTGHERNVLGDDAVGWTFGGLIRESTGLPLTETNFGPVLYLLIPRATLDGMTVLTDTYQVSESAAGFGSIDWHLTDRLDLTTGVRYTYEWKDAGVTRERTGGCPSCTPLYALDVLGALLGSDLGGLTVDGLLDSVAGGEYERYTTRDEGAWSGQVALTYKFTPETMSYLSIARGYKGGGINLGATGESVKPTFEPEEATSYELGAKTQLAKRAFISFATYYTEVDDYQALTFDEEQTLIPNPRQINLLNVGKVTLAGAELEGYGYALPGLMLRAGAAYNRAITQDFPNAPSEVTRVNDKDLSGETLYNAPRWSTTAGADYSFPLSYGVAPYAGLDYSYRSGYWATVEHGSGSYVDSYSLVNARLGLRENDRMWDVSLWVRNLLDEDYLAAVYALYGIGDYGATAGDARTYGVTVRANFK